MESVSVKDIGGEFLTNITIQHNLNSNRRLVSKGDLPNFHEEGFVLDAIDCFKVRENLSLGYVAWTDKNGQGIIRLYT